MSIQEHLNKIRNAEYGSEVRESIAKGIETAYDDASEKDNANMEVKITRGTNPNLNTRLNKMEDTGRQNTAQLAQTERTLIENKTSLSSLNSKVGELGASSTFKGSDSYLNIMSKTGMDIGDEWYDKTNGQSLRWNGSLWSPVGSSIKLGERSIGLDKTTFSNVVSNNKFDKMKVSSGVLNSTGGVSDNENFLTTDYIRTVKGDVWESNFAMQAVSFYYTNSKSLQSHNDAYGQSEIVSPVDGWIRVSFFHTNIDTFMLSKDGLPIEYEPYKEAINGIHLSDINGRELLKNSVNESKLTFLKKSENLYDPDSVVKGFYVNPDNGNLSANNSYDTVEIQGINAEEKYTVTTLRSGAFYDANGNVIEGLAEISNPKNYTFTTPANTHSFKLSYQTGTDKFMVIKGETMPDYIKSGYNAPNLLIKAENVVESVQNSNDISINLPSKLYATIGDKFTIYNANILKEKSENYNIRYRTSLGAQYDDRFETTPNNTGTYPLTVEVYDKNNLVASKPVSIEVSNVRNTPIKVMVLGDSIVRSNGDGFITQNLLDMLGNNLELIGTMGVGLNKWEGRGGWTASKYRTGDSYNGVVNPFYNPTKQDFDFTYYMNQNGFTDLDVVVINLGVNDVFNAQTDEMAKVTATAMITHLLYIKQSILSFDGNIKVAFNIPIPPNAKQQKFAEQKLANTDIDQTQWRAKYNNFILVNEMIGTLGATTDLVSAHIGIDTLNNISDHVHPNEAGYKQVAMTDYAYLNSL